MLSVPVKPAGRCTPLLLILLLYPTLPVWLFFLAVSIAFALISYTLNGSCINEYNYPIWNQVSKATCQQYVRTLFHCSLIICSVADAAAGSL
jgi:membrane glycosyltransferase